LDCHLFGNPTDVLKTVVVKTAAFFCTGFSSSIRRGFPQRRQFQPNLLKRLDADDLLLLELSDDGPASFLQSKGFQRPGQRIDQL
jgi:hypothetical protein